jgi:hypothetical protein
MTYYRRPYPVRSGSAVKFARAATAYIPATDKFAAAILKIAWFFPYGTRLRERVQFLGNG